MNGVFYDSKIKNLSGLTFEMEDSANVLVADSSISKFSPERFVFWNVKINRS